jgi:hypothetical protein
MMTLEINPPKQDRRDAQPEPTASLNLVLVASEPSRCGGGPGERRPRPSVAGPNGLNCTRVAAHIVGGAAAWSRRVSSGRLGVSPMFDGPIGPAPGGVADRPEQLMDLLGLMERSYESDENREAIVEAIVALRTADAVVVGPLSPEDANVPGLLPHLADQAGRAYRALRPPRELIVHPAFGQVARRFGFIQMNEKEARALGAGAADLGILAQRLRRLQGDPGEFAITAFGHLGLLWADNAWWDIEPIGDVDEATAGAVFCMAWVVARRFRTAGAEQALAYARAVTAAAVRPGARG